MCSFIGIVGGVFFLSSFIIIVMESGAVRNECLFAYVFKRRECFVLWLILIFFLLFSFQFWLQKFKWKLNDLPAPYKHITCSCNVQRKFRYFFRFLLWICDSQAITAPFIIHMLKVAWMRVRRKIACKHIHVDRMYTQSCRHFVMNAFVFIYNNS